MDAETWSAIAAVGSVLTAIVVSVSQLLATKKQRVFDLFQMFESTTYIDDNSHPADNIKSFNAVFLCAQKVESGFLHISTTIDVFGRFYIILVDGILSLQRFNLNGKNVTGKQLLDMPEYACILRVRTMFYDTILERDHNYVHIQQ